MKTVFNEITTPPAIVNFWIILAGIIVFALIIGLLAFFKNRNFPKSLKDE